jgi:hypothetical protein
LGTGFVSANCLGLSKTHFLREKFKKGWERGWVREVIESRNDRFSVIENGVNGVLTIKEMKEEDKSVVSINICSMRFTFELKFITIHGGAQSTF